MANTIKNQQDILTKLNIHRPNPMQQEAIAVIETTANTILLSPTFNSKSFCEKTFNVKKTNKIFKKIFVFFSKASYVNWLLGY